jgi:glycerol-3-phosphate dehydrogenase
VHGGVRYLAQGNLPLVREALRERGLLGRNAPHLVHARDFIVPAHHYWQIPYYGAGLWLYDRLSGRLSLGHSRWISRREVLERIPNVKRKGLQGGILYKDGQFDDARLAVTLARTAVDLGATALNHAPVVGLLKHNGRLTGVRVRDNETGAEFTASARCVVNATGVYADELRRLDEPDAAPLLSPSQGAHVVLDRSFLRGDAAIMVPRTDDGRVLFVIPWLGHALIGTTDVPLSEIPREPRPLDEELAFLIEHAGRYLETAPTLQDVKSQFAGLRPLIGGGTATKKLSREHAVIIADSGLVTITGGKWTTYRVMASDAVNQAATVAGFPRKPCLTADLHLHGWTAQPAAQGDPLAEYGSDAAPLRALIDALPGGSDRLHPDLPHVAGEVVWAARHEAARTVEDVLARRTRALFLDVRASLASAPCVASLLSAELGKDRAWEDDQIARFQKLAAGYLPMKSEF